MGGPNLGDDLFGDVTDAVLIGVDDEPRGLRDVVVKYERVAVLLGDILDDLVDFFRRRLGGGFDLLLVTSLRFLVGAGCQLQIVLLFGAQRLSGVGPGLQGLQGCRNTLQLCSSLLGKPRGFLTGGVRGERGTATYKGDVQGC